MICNRCLKNTKFYIENQAHFDDIPQELLDLTISEQMIISQTVPAV